MYAEFDKVDDSFEVWALYDNLMDVMFIDSITVLDGLYEFFIQYDLLLTDGYKPYDN